jgi:hypothetical protein
MAAIYREVVPQDSEMCTPSTKRSRAMRRKSSQKADREKVNMQPDCDTKRVLLDAMVLDQTIVIGSNLSADEEGNLVQFL